MLAIPTVLVVASWDNLTTKGVIRDVPDMTIVWNEDQVREAIEFRGVPAGAGHGNRRAQSRSLVLLGTDHRGRGLRAQGRTRRRAPVRALRLLLRFIAGDDEPEFVREWARRLAESGDPELARLGVIVRPHPQNLPSWRDADLEEPGRIVVWPRGGVRRRTCRARGLLRFPVPRKGGDRDRHHRLGRQRDRAPASFHDGLGSFPQYADGNASLLVSGTGRRRRPAERRSVVGRALPAARRRYAFVDGHRDRIDGFLRTFVRPHRLDRPPPRSRSTRSSRWLIRRRSPSARAGCLRWIVGTTARALGRLHRLLGDLRPEPLRKRLNRRRKLRAQAERRRDRQPKASGGAKPAKADRAAIKAERAAAKAERAKEKARYERTG